jgi:hypothetical protein
MIIVKISHVINVLVAGSMAFLLFIDASNITTVYGEATHARSILTSVYFAIAATSLFALIFPLHSIAIAKVLFPLQILYKLSTLVTVGSFSHPVVLSNILISVFHALSLLVILKYSLHKSDTA